MEPELAEEILKEGVDVLYSQLGTIKTLKFFQLIGLGRGDSVKEIEEKTEKMSKNEILNLIKENQTKREQLWKKLGML